MSDDSEDERSHLESLWWLESQSRGGGRGGLESEGVRQSLPRVSTRVSQGQPESEFPDRGI